MASFNFRNTAGYVTDGVGETYVILGDTYPTVRDGLTFGWDTSLVQTRDRNTGIDQRLAGTSFITDTNGYAIFSTDSGSGTFDVTIASGDASFGPTNSHIQIVEVNSSQVVQSVLSTVLNSASFASGQFYDATGVLRTSAADWVTNNATTQVTVASGNHLALRIGEASSSGAGTSHVAHFSYTSAAASFAIDSTDASMQRNGTFDVTFSNPATAPTTGNTSLSQGGDTLTCTGITGSDPYTATFSVGDLSKQVDATGYDWTLTVDAETDTTGNIPLTIQSGWTKVDLVSPITTNASILFGVSGDTPVTGDDAEYTVTSTLDSGVSFSVAADGVWTVTEAVEGDWVTDITVDRRVVQADGTIGTTDTLTLDASTGTASIGEGVVTAVVSNVISNVISSVVN